MADRNLNPHAEARLAMALWGGRYAAQNGGCMDFWDGLTASEKATCVRIVDGILSADRAMSNTPREQLDRIKPGERKGE